MIRLASLLRALRLSVVVVTPILLLGCGGGTSGSDNVKFTKIFEGTVTDTELSPLSDVQVSLLESGASDSTDGTGSFSITSELEPGDATLLFDANTFEAVASLGTIPDGETVTTVSVELDAESNAANVTSLDTRSASAEQSDEVAEEQQQQGFEPEPITDRVARSKRFRLSAKLFFAGGSPFIGDGVLELKGFQRRSTDFSFTEQRNDFPVDISTKDTADTFRVTIRINNQSSSFIIKNVSASIFRIDLRIRLSRSRSQFEERPTGRFSLAPEIRSVTLVDSFAPVPGGRGTGVQLSR